MSQTTPPDITPTLNFKLIRAFEALRDSGLFDPDIGYPTDQPASTSQSNDYVEKMQELVQYVAENHEAIAAQLAAMHVEDNYSRIKRSHACVFEATHTASGIRSRFRVAEHVNIGRGYMMCDMDGKVRGIVGEEQLSDLVPIPDDPASPQTLTILASSRDSR